jgi:Protein of unknown function (DUF3455)
MIRFSRLFRSVGVGLAVAAATLAMTQVAHADLAPPNVPDAIKPPTGSQLFLVGHAKGVQKYTCDGVKWVLPSVPQADLIDDAGNLIVTHFGGPTWKATDGSAVRGQLPPAGNVPSPAAGPAIPWLLLSTVPADGSATTGLLVGTKFIQRINTQGGTQPPAAECKAQTSGKVKEVPYKADYFFWK